MDHKIWIAEELREERPLICHPAEDPMEDIGQKTQDGCKETYTI